MTAKPMLERTPSTASKPVISRRFLVLAGLMAVGLIALVGRMIYLASVHEDLRQQRSVIVEHRAQVAQPASGQHAR